jgi:metallo-beta-lactamase class B
MRRTCRTIKALAALAAGAFFLGAAPAGSIALAPVYQAMTAPQAPFQIADNLYYVGASDVTSYLIVTGGGKLILLDGGLGQTAPQILANIRKLGFDPRNVRILLNSHAHFDHAGGLAALKAATGAMFLASDGDAPVLAAGGTNDFALKNAAFPPIKADHPVVDGMKVALGGVTLTAHITAGHTKGCTTWTMPVTIEGETKEALFLCSLTVLPQFRLIGDPNYPNQADDFVKSFATLKTLKCEVFLASHGSSST